MLAWFVYLKVTWNVNKSWIYIKDAMEGCYVLVRKTKKKVLKTQWFQWELRSWLKQKQDILDCILTICSWENSWPLRDRGGRRKQIVFLPIKIPYKKI